MVSTRPGFEDFLLYEAILGKAPTSKLAFRTVSTNQKRQNPQPTFVPASTKDVATGQPH